MALIAWGWWQNMAGNTHSPDTLHDLMLASSWNLCICLIEKNNIMFILWDLLLWKVKLSYKYRKSPGEWIEMLCPRILILLDQQHCLFNLLCCFFVQFCRPQQCGNDASDLKINCFDWKEQFCACNPVFGHYKDGNYSTKGCVWQI